MPCPRPAPESGPPWFKTPCLFQPLYPWRLLVDLDVERRPSEPGPPGPGLSQQSPRPDDSAPPDDQQGAES